MFIPMLWQIITMDEVFIATRSAVMEHAHLMAEYRTVVVQIKLDSRTALLRSRDLIARVEAMLPVYWPGDLLASEQPTSRTDPTGG